jgi:translocation and assembly module TamB
MRVLRRALLAFLTLVVVLPVAAVAVVWIGLNTGAGRQCAVREINKLAGPGVQVAGLGGHFPADVMLRHLALADADGVYATADGLQLRWRPLQIFSRHLDVSVLRAASVDVERAPVAGQNNRSGSNPSFGLPKLRVDVDQLTIGALHVAPSLAGQDVTLGLGGSAHLADLDLQNPAHDQLILNADAAGKGSYQLAAVLEQHEIDARVKIAEPPDGLLGHLAGPQLHAPLNVDLSLAGPQDSAKLAYAASFGAAAVNGAGTLALNPNAPQADITLNVPALAPVAALAGENLAGSTTLHVVAKHLGETTDLALDGQVGLTAGPGPSAKLIGPHGKISVLASLVSGDVDLESLNIAGAAFDLAADGNLAANGFYMNTHIALADIGDLSPGLSGPVTEDGSVQGVSTDFSIGALLTGDIAQRDIPSGPFSITVNAAHLPSTPVGTLTGSGALEGAPLLLDAQFSRNATGMAHVLINNALWRSLSAQGDVSLNPGETLPTGTAKFAIGNLANFAAFSPVKLSGSVDGDFAHQGGQNFSLDLNAHNLVAVPSLGAVNATLNASGPVNALAVKIAGTIAKILNAPARLSLAGVFNLNARAATISAFAASWRSVDARLRGPAGIETQPGIAVHHLALALNGGSVTLDGKLTPALNLTLSAKKLPLSLAGLFTPGLDATGTIGMDAALSGAPSSPSGKISLDARNVRLHQGPAASLPAADLHADVALTGKTANVSATLGLGPSVSVTADGLVPLRQTGPLSVHLTGRTDLRLLDPILAAQGTTIRGVITPDLVITGTPAAPLANGTVTLADGSVQNIASGLNLTAISASIGAAGRLISLQHFQATAGPGTIDGQGTLDLGAPALPIDLILTAANATPVSSDLATESINANLAIKGALRGRLALSGAIDLLRANINIPQSLPPSVADLPIINEGQKPPPPPAPPPDISLDLTIRAKRQIFIRGDGLFAELGGKVRLTGTAADPNPQGGFTLIRGNFALAGKTLQFTQGTVDFTGDGFIPTLDLEATTITANNTSASLIIGGTAEKPTITLSASPPLPSDEVLSALLFGQSTSSLSPFQAASLAAALASLSGVGGSAIADPLGGVRNALGLDELSLGGSGSGAPTVNAGRYVAPGVYVGAQQSTSGQGTQATVQINLYKGLQLQTSTGTSGAGSGASSSIGLTYQFNY